MNYFSTLITLLRDRPVFLEEVRIGTKLESKIFSLIVASSLFFAILPGLRIFIIVEAAGVHILCTVERMSKNYAGTKD